MSDIKIVIAADVVAADAGLKKVQQELGKTALEAAKTDSKLQGLGNAAQNVAGKSSLMSSAAASLKNNLLSIISPTQLAIAGIVAIGVAISDWINQETKAEKQLKMLEQTLTEVSSSFVKANNDVKAVANKLDDYYKGTATADEVTKLFNKTLGETVGKVGSVTQAEKSLADNADNYIKIQTSKAVANMAFNKSAELIYKSLEASLLQERIIQDIRKKGNVATYDEVKKLTDLEKERKKSLEDIDVYKNIEKEAEKYQKFFEKLLIKPNKSKIIVGDILNDEVVIKPSRIKIKTDSLKKSDIKELEKYLMANILATSPYERKESVNDIGRIKPKEFSLSDITKDPSIQRLIKQKELLTEIASIATTILSPALDAVFDNIGKGASKVVQSLGNVIKQLTLAVFKALALQAISSLITGGGKLGKDFLGNFFKGFFVGKNATGTRNFKGGLTLVGERGPELLALPSGSSIQPNNEMNAYSFNGGITLMPSIAYDGTMFRVFLNRVDAQNRRNN